MGKLHNKEPHDLYPSSNNVMLIKSGRMRRVGHVTLVDKQEMYMNI